MDLCDSFFFFGLLSLFLVDVHISITFFFPWEYDLPLSWLFLAYKLTITKVFTGVRVPSLEGFAT